MKTLRMATLLMVFVGLPAVGKADLGIGWLTGDVVIDARLVVVSFSSNGGWSEELGFESDLLGKYQVTAPMGIIEDKTVIEYGSIDVKGRANPFLSYQFDFTNFGSDPIDQLHIDTVIEIEPLNELSFMTSLLSVEYVDHDGSGGVNATASHRAFPQTESSGGFAAQEIVLTINEAGKFEQTLDPTLPEVPDFLPPPFDNCTS